MTKEQITEVLAGSRVTAAKLVRDNGLAIETAEPVGEPREQRLTEDQAWRIAHTLSGPRCESVLIAYGPFDLPDGYVGVRFTYNDHGADIHGGIDRDGAMST